MFSEKLSRIYTGLEERYYALLDFLDARGLPVYKYNDFLENRGMPAFPITIALIVLIIAAIYGIFFIGNTINPSVTISFQDQFSQTVAGVQVSVKDSAGRAVAATKTIASGESIQLQGIGIGSRLVVSASKEGYETAEGEITVVKEKIPLSMQLRKQIKEIAIDLQVIDEETGDAVKGASVQLEWQGVTRTGTTDAGGKTHFTGIPEGTAVTVKVQADAYEQLSTTKSFFENELATIELVPDTAALAGITKVIVSVEDEAGAPVEGAKITIMDRGSDTAIAERTIEESEALFDVTKGTSVRLIVQKEGFLRYDSMQSSESRTLRLDEEEWPVILLKGGSKLDVTVLAGQTPLSDAAVQLFDLNNNPIDSATTDFAGEAEFKSLLPEQYFATAYMIGYLPARQLVNIAETEAVTIALTAADTSNSAYLGISVFDSYSAAANNADLFFFEKIAGEELPLGIPAMKTDITGYAAIKPAISATVVVKAKKDLQEGSGEKLIEANKENQMVIELSKPLTVVELQIVDSLGNPVQGAALIETVSGELLFDGNITDGRVYFDARGNKEINLTVTTADGQTFSQQVDIEGKETVKVTLGEQVDTMAPTVNFLGIFNENDELVEGITAAKFYWAKFEINWPTGIAKGGFHARIGSDDDAFADSQPVGIMGFDATTGSYFYGKSFQPLPLPGNEAADKQNAGSAGQFNKFVELYFTQPENTTVVKVKIKARESILAESVELHFRAWSEAGGLFYRQPADAELGDELFSSNKTALYAETHDETINVFSSDAVCEEEVCASYFFVMPNGLFVEKQEFKPMTDALYALEIDLKAGNAVDATIKLDTDKAAPLLYFTGYEVDGFADRPDAETVETLPPQTDLGGQGYIDWAEGDATAQTSGNPLGFKENGSETSLTIGVSIAKGESRKVRIYFKPFAAGKANIKSQVVAGSAVLNEEFVFNIEQQEFLLLRLSPEDISVGQDFTITAMDKDNGNAVQNATIHLQDGKGKDAAVIVGNGATRKGLDGEYFFKNSFNPGNYKAVASAPGYATEELPILIAKDGLLSIKSPIKIDIAKGEQSKSVTASLKNTAKEDIGEISYELEKESDFPAEFSVTAEIPPTIAAGKDATATITVNLELAEESEDTLYGEADLIVKGMAAANYPTKTKTRLIINYNKQLDADCLKLNASEIMIRLIGTAGSSAGEQLEIENTCETQLSLTVKVKAQEDDPNLSVTAQNLQIAKDATEKMLITASNRIDRLYAMQERKYFTITLESPQLAKSVQLAVELWNPSFNLSYPPTIALWLAKAMEESSYAQPGGGMAYAQSPLQIMNNGFAPITAFRAAVEDTAYRRFGITADIRPYAIQGINLQANQAISPMRYVYAETSKTEALKEPSQGYIYFTGVVMGHQYPDLGRTELAINYTGTQCLKASAVQSMLFSSRKADAILEKEIRLRNECGEQVRIIGTVKPAKVAGNQFMLFPANITIGPGQESNFALRLIGSQDMDRAVKIRAIGLLVAQGKTIESNDLDAIIKLGELIATAEGKGTEKISIKNCNDEAKPKQLSFPILSSDCSQGYCNAKQLAAFLINKADNLAKMAKDKAAMASQQASKYSNCAAAGRIHCSFEEMGLTTETFPVFLQLDFLDSTALEQELREQSKTELKDYGVQVSPINLQEMGGGSFRFKNIYLSSAFKGCGKYYVQVNGAVQVINGELMSESPGNMVIAISIEQDRADTEQCKHLIENAANFLPVDEGYTINARYNSWPGFVEGSAEFGELPKMLAKELFKKEEGRYAATAPAGNRIVLVKGGADNGLLKIRIEKTGTATGPKKVTAHVNDAFNPADREMADSIAKALAAFKAYSFGENDCWGEDDTGQYILMKSSRDLEPLYGKLLLDGEKAIKINSQEQCIDLNITTGYSQEKITRFETDFAKTPKTGIEYVAIYLKEGYEKETKTTLLKELANGSTGTTTAWNTKWWKEYKEAATAAASEPKSRQSFKTELLFCIKGTDSFSLAVKELKITAFGSATLDRKTEPFTVSIGSCGIHPYDLVKEIGKVTTEQLEKEPEKQIVAFATVGWKGSPDKIDIIAMQRATAAEAAKSAAEKLYGTGAGIPTAQQPAYMQEIAQRKLTGIWTAYFLPCAATSAVYGVIMHFGWGALWDVSLDCTLPATVASWDAVKDLGGVGKTMLEAVEGFVKRVVPFIGEWLVGEKATTVPLEAEAQTAAESFSENILPTAIFGVGADSLRLAVTNGGAVITKNSADTAGAQVSKAVFERLRATTFKKSLADNAIEAQVESMLTEAQTEYAKRISSNIVSAKALDPKKIKFIDNALVDSSKKAFGEMGETINNRIIQLGINGKLGGEPGKLFDSVRKSSLDNMFNEAKVVERGKLGITAGDLELPKVAPLEVTAKIDEMKTAVVGKMKENIVSELQQQSPALKKAMEDTAFKNSVETNIRETLENAIKPQKLYDGQNLASRGKFQMVETYSIKIAQSDLDNAARNTVVTLQSKVGNEIVEKAIGKNVGKEFAEKILTGAPEHSIVGMSNDIIDPKIGAARLSKLKTNLKQANRFLTMGTVGNVIKNLAKGIAGGVLANYMGYQGWKYYWEKYGTQPVPGGVTISGDAPKVDRDGDGRFNEDPVDGVDNDGDGLIDEDYPLLASQELENGQTYKIIISQNVENNPWGLKGTRSINFVKLQSEKDFEDMRKELLEKKAVLWEEADCKNFKGKGVEKYLGSLAPVATKEVTSEHVIAYYEYNPLIANAALGVVGEDPGTLLDDLPEEELMAILIVQPEKIKGCNIEKSWHLPLQNENQDATKERVRLLVECAAGKLRDAKEAHQLNFKEALKEFNAETKYVELVAQTKDVWAKFKIVQPK